MLMSIAPIPTSSAKRARDLGFILSILLNIDQKANPPKVLEVYTHGFGGTTNPEIKECVSLGKNAARSSGTAGLAWGNTKPGHSSHPN
jgi:hypothetical protein